MFLDDAIEGDLDNVGDTGRGEGLIHELTVGDDVRQDGGDLERVGDTGRGEGIVRELAVGDDDGDPQRMGETGRGVVRELSVGDDVRQNGGDTSRVGSGAPAGHHREGRTAPAGHHRGPVGAGL